MNRTPLFHTVCAQPRQVKARKTHPGWQGSRRPRGCRHLASVRNFTEGVPTVSLVHVHRRAWKKDPAGSGEEQVPARRSVAKREKFPADKSATTLRGQGSEQVLHRLAAGLWNLRN